MKKSDLYWLAGILEGEGCFSVNRQRNGKSYVYIQMATADRDVLEKVVLIAGGNIGGPYKGRSSHHSPMYRWSRSGDTARKIMKAIFPLMSLRRKQQIVKQLKEVDGKPPEWAS